MYNEEGADPVLIKEVTTSTFVQSVNEAENRPQIQMYPSVLSSGELLRISSSVAMEKIHIYSLSGELVHVQSFSPFKEHGFHLSLSAGVYLVSVKNKNSSLGVTKLIIE